MFKLWNVTLFSTKRAHFKFDACYRSQRLAWGQQRAEKARHFEKIQLGEHLATNEVNWHQVCNLISSKILAKLRWTEALQFVKEYVTRLWNTSKTMFIDIKFPRLCKSHHLQCITSSKDSEKLEKSLCVRDKAEDLCWIPVVFGPSDETASLICMILSLTLLNGPRNTSRNHSR